MSNILFVYYVFVAYAPHKICIYNIATTEHFHKFVFYRALYRTVYVYVTRIDATMYIVFLCDWNASECL